MAESNVPAPRRTSRFPSLKGDASAYGLIFSNLLVIVLAVYEHWSLAQTMIIYWAQSVIIGFFNVVRILRLKEQEVVPPKKNGVTPPAGTWDMAKYVLAGFFAVHYGFFHYGYFSFLRSSLRGLDLKPVLFASFMFFLNHLISYLYNYNADRGKVDIQRVMFYPYTRIIPMHLTILFGGAVMLLFRSAFAEQVVLVLFLVLKTVADVKMHAQEHSHGGHPAPLA